MREAHQWAASLPPPHPLGPGIECAAQVCALYWEINLRPFSVWGNALVTEPHGPAQHWWAKIEKDKWAKWCALICWLLLHLFSEPLETHFPSPHQYGEKVGEGIRWRDKMATGISDSWITLHNRKAYIHWLNSGDNFGIPQFFILQALHFHFTSALLKQYTPPTIYCLFRPWIQRADSKSGQALICPVPTVI